MAVKKSKSRSRNTGSPDAAASADNNKPELRAADDEQSAINKRLDTIEAKIDALSSAVRALLVAQLICEIKEPEARPAAKPQEKPKAEKKDSAKADSPASAATIKRGCPRSELLEELCRVKKLDMSRVRDHQISNVGKTIVKVNIVYDNSGFFSQKHVFFIDMSTGKVS